MGKRDGAHAHEHADSGYGAPPATYEEPAASYGAPAPTYEEPASGYGAPAPSYGYEEEPLPDLTPIIVGILVLTGLSLLFPTFVSLTTVGRKKRHAEDEGDHQTDVIERVNEIYTAVVQSEECMDKIACEVGALAGDVGLTQSPALKLAGGFVPSKYKTTTSNSPLARIATKSSAAPSLKSLIEEAVSEVSLRLVYFGSGNFIPDPEKKLFHQDGCIEALHCQKTISSNTNAISILSFYLIFLLSYQKSSS